jgi:pheromone a factor receptor
MALRESPILFRISASQFHFSDYIVQGHRFDIIEGYGCRPTTYFSIPAIFIVWIPPILLSIIAIVYSGLALRHFMIRRVAFAAHLSSSNSALTTSRYLRLMTMAALQMVWSITVTSYALWFTVVAVPIRPWTTWSDVHSDWLRIDLFPDAFTPDFVKRAFYVLWWLVPISTFLFVGFFAFGKDAMDEYRKCFVWFRVKVLRQNPSPNSSKGPSSSVQLSKTKFIRGLPISNPKSMLDSDVSASTLPAYSPSKSSFSSTRKQASLNDYDSDAHSELTRYEPSPYGGGKAIGSYTDFSLRETLTTAGPFTPTFRIPEVLPELPPTPPSPLTPPPMNPRLRALILTPSSPPSRPLTYPSFDDSPRGIKPQQLGPQ